ncbi:16S rRNA (cytosine(967)-C(5))-methyltransferase RsmB [Pannonibacter sp. Pt2]|uniref:16S rRNA (cytosine(967)-C(5))-methyltransferase n=1 Tax=Pannonibacter anstelovis TaxID=3121537 RepID=A0ABU7ZM20_9HYPH
MNEPTGSRPKSPSRPTGGKGAPARKQGPGAKAGGPGTGGGSPGRPAPGFAARKVAADILGNVVHKHRTLDAEYDVTSGHSGFRALEPKDRSLVKAIVAAALRRRGQLDAILAELLDRPIPERTGRVTDILHVAAVQILFLDVADHAAVSLAVDLAGSDKRARPYKGLVNGVLRRLAREKDTLSTITGSGPAGLPLWLATRWRETYGAETFEAILRAHLEEPALDLTVKSDAEGWAERLGGRVVAAGSVRLSRKGAVDGFEGFNEGGWWVQDAAASLPARLLGDLTGKRAADLCAAPGGKTAQLATQGADVTAVDISEKRLKRVHSNLERLGLSARVVAADLRSYEPDEPFDAILLDAPCSATGTMRRHPDVAWTKRPADVTTLAAIQAELLRKTVTWLKPGGVLVYCTCSMEREEGEDQIAALLAEMPGIALEPVLPAEIGGLAECITPEGYLRTLPCHLGGGTEPEGGLDGFFAARLRRL